MPPNFNFPNSDPTSDTIVLFDGNQSHWIKEHGYGRWYWAAALGDIALSALGIWLSFALYKNQLDGGIYIFMGAMISLVIPPFLIIIPFRKLVDGKELQDTMEHLASITGYSFSPSAPMEIMQGSLSGVGRDRRILNVFSGTYDNRPMLSFQYWYTINEGKYEVDRGYAVTKLQFAHALPRMQLVNATMVTIPHADMKSLQLEGDFQHHFLLYAAQGNEIEDLQIFTPDFMASLIDMYPSMNFECINNTLYLYDGITNGAISWGKLSKKNIVEFYAKLDFLISALSRFETKEHPDALSS